MRPEQLAADPLCDGSDAIRLELSVSHGFFTPPGATFTNPFGASFAFVHSTLSNPRG